MKAFFAKALPVLLVFAFIGCSSGGGSDSGNQSNSDVNVPKCGNNVDEILLCAVTELKRENWDEAIAYYNIAYNKDNNNPKAIIYSTLANLAKISTDPKVVALMKQHFGFTNYPNRLNALLSDKWMKEYEGSTLPAIKTPDWLKGQGSIYNNALLSGNVMSADNWALSLFANVIDKNSNGFNPLLDDVIGGVFGLSYNVAVERLKKLENRKEERITLDPYFIDKLDLRDIFDAYDKIGWAEANVIVSAMLLVKASLEWVQSYDLSTDLNWLKYAWKDDPDDIVKHFKNVDANKLPFNNNFLKVRPGKMATAKADYVKAIRGFQDSYASIVNSDLYPREIKNAYTTINGGFNALIGAINNGGKFYIPDDPTKGTWPTAMRSDVEATINLGKFFEEGYFSLQNIFETNAGKPAFYLETEICEDYYWWCDYTYTKLDKNNYASLISSGGRLSLGVKIATFSAVSGKQDEGIEYFSIGLSRDAAKAVFEKYYP
ncbi:MAG: hypothetical protein LBH25_01140 [Fibromonadaceae bacterium]|jgi:hypothetical protein|nr:hypothetical protein [Fibromonadaceae bacterium]